MLLNWVPEPEFGGIYAAKQIGAYEKRNLDVTIKPGGAGAPTWQQVASGKAEFGVASADEVVIARANGADVVAFFTIYQTCPQGIMVHASRGLKSIDQVFASGGTLAMEVGLPYGKFLQKKFGFEKVKRIPYSGGVANFLADKNFAQQCFIFSEPLTAKKQGADPQTFLIADAGYNPYTGVIIANGEFLKKNPTAVKAMDAETFAAAAEAQKPLVESDETKAQGLGAMSADRWEQLIKQLVDIGVVESAKAPAAKDCFVKPALLGAAP